MKKISILIGTCNINYLKESLESIIRNTDFEVIDAEVVICINGGEPEIISYVQSLGSRFRFIWVDRRIGHPAAYNLAARFADGEYLIKTDDDLLILDWGGNNNWIDRLLEPFQNDAKMGQVGPQFELLFGNHPNIVGTIFMTKKKIWDELGGLDEIFSPGCGDDTDFCIKLQLAGYHIANIGNDLLNEAGRNWEVFFNYPMWHKGNENYSGNIREIKKKEFCYIS